MSKQEDGDARPSPRIIWWDRLEPAVTPRYDLEDFVSDEDFDSLVTDS